MSRSSGIERTKYTPLASIDGTTEGEKEAIGTGSRARLPTVVVILVLLSTAVLSGLSGFLIANRNCRCLCATNEGAFDHHPVSKIQRLTNQTIWNPLDPSSIP